MPLDLSGFSSKYSQDLFPVFFFLGGIRSCNSFLAVCYLTHNGGQKCWDLSSDISKTSDPSPATPNKVEFWAKLGGKECLFWPQDCWGEWGDDGLNPFWVIRNIVLRSSYLKELFHTVPSSFVLYWRLEPLLIISPCKATCLKKDRSLVVICFLSCRPWYSIASTR